MPASTHVRALLAALSLAVLPLAACATHNAATTTATPSAAARPVVLVDNAGTAWLDVYLLDETRDWHLGRLAPGARGTLRLPAGAAAGAGMVRLAVLAGATQTVAPSRDPRAIVSMAQPMTALSGQRWSFAQGALTGLRPH
ncbi:hypothetical protein [Roseisolibacter agri]|uniref:Uncharacterized protein n=1 Tax=Roseisolibacter agri TaxID=2014610 RepID=A0AA37Q3C7_9BACT|nr:hypothetical protein [Roseisolibacter agri]GLC23857.1 hypothetical protein rosag_03700 [Roseisolibacter agri]